MERPVLALTCGDPAGIGPEIVLKALAHRQIYEWCIPLVLGDRSVLEEALKVTGLALRLKEQNEPKGAAGLLGAVDYMDLGVIGGEKIAPGKVSPLAGEAAFRSVVMGISLAQNHLVQGVVTAPINKEALNLAGHHFSGHTEIFARYTGCGSYAMLLASKNLRVIHVTTHLPLRKVCEEITKERVLETIRLGARALNELDLPEGKIAVAGLNPHCSENGLFGDEEERAIIPAIRLARSEGIQAEGPVPADTVFVKALAGQYALVVAMYHDQGHIPLKLYGFRMDSGTGEFTAVSGVNCTIGLPIVRTSVDHGTAFDRAGRGTANEESMVEAIRMGATMARRRR